MPPRLKQNGGNWLMSGKTELEKKNVLRQSAKEANALTRECIELALISLMKEKPFAKIKITEIIKRAGVSRVSYYRNYDSKEAILENHLQGIVREATRTLLEYDVATQSKDAWVTLLQFTREHADEILMLLDAGFGDTLLRQFIAGMNRNNPEGEDWVFVSNWYLSGCMFAVITQWLKEGMAISEQAVADVCSSMMLEGLQGFKDFPSCKA
jgi:AcrR family transcriptional regulator